MTRCLTSLCGVVLLTGSMAVDAHAQAAAANAHVEAARAAIAPPTENPLAPFHIFQGLFDMVCAEPTLPDVMRTQERSADAVPRDEWFAWPADIFDNLYFIGTQTAGVWAIDTSDGIIVIDASFHYSSQDLVLELLHFGLEPDAIKYIIVTHGHDDRYWGAKALQDTYPEARVAMSAADWDVVAEDNSPAELKPRRDMGRHRRPADHARRRDRHAVRHAGPHAGHAVDDHRAADEPEDHSVGRRTARGGHLGRRRCQHRTAGGSILSRRRGDDDRPR